MTPKLTDLWITQQSFPETAQFIQADFSNERHHQVQIRDPGDASAVEQALHVLARMIGGDPELAPKE